LALHLLDLRERGETDSAAVAQALLVVESFLVRRLLIGRATANINRVLLDVVTEMDKDLPVDEAIHRYLSTGRKYFASDEDVRAALTSVPFYLNGRAPQRTLLLRWIEETYESKEPVQPGGLTIEHVLPQSPTPAWLDVLADEVEEDEEPEDLHERLLHTLGNLTLTGYNSNLSNHPFETKRAKLATSGVAMNQEIAAEQRWGKTQILARACRQAGRPHLRRLARTPGGRPWGRGAGVGRPGGRGGSAACRVVDVVQGSGRPHREPPGAGRTAGGQP
jgi:hypothetical protein